MNEIEKALKTLEEENAKIEAGFLKQVDFTVDNGYVSELPKAILANFEEVKSFIEERTENDRFAVVTEDNLSQAKQRCALLNKQIDNIEKQRKEVKKQWNRPYLDFEIKCKQLVDILKEAKDNQWQQILDMENKDKKQKEEEYKSYYIQKATEAKTIEYRDWAQIFNTAWVNKNKRLDEVLNEIDLIVEQTAMEVQTIMDLESEFEVELLRVYKNGASLTQVLAVNKDLKAQKQAVETQKQESRVNTQENKKQPSELKFESQNIQTELITIEFRVEGTAKQLENLKTFMLSENIRFGKIK